MDEQQPRRGQSGTLVRIRRPIETGIYLGFGIIIAAALAAAVILVAGVLLGGIR